MYCFLLLQCSLFSSKRKGVSLFLGPSHRRVSLQENDKKEIIWGIHRFTLFSARPPSTPRVYIQRTDTITTHVSAVPQ